MSIIKKFTTLSIALIFLIGSSCKKPAGPGGNATIKGNVYARNFDNYGMSVISEYYIAGENVYICYGNDDAVRNNVKTSIGGYFEFLYLTAGHYKVFVTSRDTSIHVKNSKKADPIIFEFNITGMNETKNLGDIIINK